MLQVRIAIVNFESGSYLAELLESLAKALEYARDRIELEVAVVVADNASSDESAGACERARLPVELRSSTCNLGFGAAANHALEAAPEPWLLVLNADLLVPQDFFVRLAESLSAASPEVAIIGPALLDEDRGVQPSVGRFPDLLQLLASAPRSRRTRKYLDIARHRAGAVDWATGACLILRREHWLKLGGFDPRFFLYYEDVDLCRRAARDGLATHFQPALQLVHRDPHAQRSVDAELLPVIRFSQLLYFRLHRPALEFAALTVATLIWSYVAQLRGRPNLDRKAWTRLRGLPARVLRGQTSPIPRSRARLDLSAVAPASREV